MCNAIDRQRQTTAAADRPGAGRVAAALTLRECAARLGPGAEAACRIGLAAGLALASGAACQAQAATAAPGGVDRWFAQVGRAADTRSVAVGAGWDWRWRVGLGARGLVTGAHDISIGHWQSDVGADRHGVTQLGITPSLRYWPTGETRRWFVEAGIGAHLLTPVYRTHDKTFSTRFNFGDHVGLGYRAVASTTEWSLRLQHFSNAGIRSPNPGENFVQLRWSVAF
ncbi:MAG: acyloxyacyl hydrolase [Burkholderiaceae bacterium]